MEIFRMDWHEREGMLGMVGAGPFLVLSWNNTMNTLTLVYRISRLAQGKNGASLRCSEYLGKDGLPKALAHFDLQGKLFSSGLPMAIVDGEEVLWTQDRRPGDDTMMGVKLEISAEQSVALLESLESIPDLKQPPLNEEGVSTLSGWQLHVEVQSETGLSTNKGVFQHWAGAEIISLSLVQRGKDNYVERERIRVDSRIVWEELGLKFEKKGEHKTLTGEEGRAAFRSLIEGKNISRNQRRRELKAANSENGTAPSKKRLEF